MSDAHTQMIWTLLCEAEEHVKTKGRTKIKKPGTGIICRSSYYMINSYDQSRPGTP